MDATWWVNLCLVAAIMVTIFFRLKAFNRKKMVEFSIKIFDITPAGELTEAQLEHIVTTLLDLHQALRQAARKQFEIFTQASTPTGRGSKLLARQLQEAEEEKRIAQITYNAAFAVACYWAPRGFGFNFHLYLLSKIPRNKSREL